MGCGLSERKTADPERQTTTPCGPAPGLDPNRTTQAALPFHASISIGSLSISLQIATLSLTVPVTEH
jgi:hypothetical protein